MVMRPVGETGVPAFPLSGFPVCSLLPPGLGLVSLSPPACTQVCTPTPFLAHPGTLCPYNTYMQALWSLYHPVLPTCVLCFCTQRPAQRPSEHLGLSALQHPSVSQSYINIADFWDTAGQERFQSMHASYYHKAHACIMV